MSGRGWFCSQECLQAQIESDKKGVSEATTAHKLKNKDDQEEKSDFNFDLAEPSNFEIDLNLSIEVGRNKEYMSLDQLAEKYRKTGI